MGRKVIPSKVLTWESKLISNLSPEACRESLFHRICISSSPMYTYTLTKHGHTRMHVHGVWEWKFVPMLNFLQAKQYVSISDVVCLHCWTNYAVVFYLVNINYSHTLCHLLLWEFNTFPIRGKTLHIYYFLCSSQEDVLVLIFLIRKLALQ